MTYGSLVEQVIVVWIIRVCMYNTVCVFNDDVHFKLVNIRGVHYVRT